ncbi:MAG: exodeoxyribonuclease IX [Xanthomonadaceae bacterium]|nr:exodeoxyribonuclease IX [Xanthomonadaceae bacterium]
MVYLVDASVYIFRAWFSIPDSMRDPAGNPVNALYGFARFLAELMERAAPAEIGVAYDESLTTSFRNEIYPLYKANREKAPPELLQQMKRCREFSEALGCATFASPVWEADDIIGTLAARTDGPVTVVTSDKDLTQLVGPADRWWNYASGRVLDRSGVFDHLGVWPEQVADMLALAGDAVDNIPGVRGIGIKTACALLQHFGSLDEIYARLDEVPWLKLRGAATITRKLEAGRAEALLARRLTTIERAADIGAYDLAWRGIDRPALDAVCRDAGFSDRLRDTILALDG